MSSDSDSVQLSDVWINTHASHSAQRTPVVGRSTVRSPHDAVFAQFQANLSKMRKNREKREKRAAQKRDIAALNNIHVTLPS
jgi:hypothetical protein